MRSHKMSEKESAVEDQIYAFRLAKLYAESQDAFYDICGKAPFFININKISNLDSIYANNLVKSFLEQDNRNIVREGHHLIRQISHPETLRYNLGMIMAYQNIKDWDSVCTFWQYLQSGGVWHWFNTQKVFLTDNLFLNVSLPVNDCGSLDRFLRNILDETFINTNGWQKFQSLSKREKEILKMIANGFTRKEIGDQLFISENTVRTHRQKIMQKIDAQSLHDIIRFAQAFEMTGGL